MNSSTDRTIKDQDEDMAGTGAALRRAARRARIIAAQTHTPLVIYKNGRIEKRMIEREAPESGNDGVGTVFRLGCLQLVWKKIFPQKCKSV